jgi:hypothetical protein
LRQTIVPRSEFAIPVEVRDPRSRLTLGVDRKH